MTGFYRDGFCRTGPEDVGLHTVCVKVTRGVSRFLRARRKRSGHAASGMGFPRTEAGRQMVRLRHALEKRA